MKKSRRTKRMQRDATGVSIVRGKRRVGIFAESQQLAGWAPLMRMPFCGWEPDSDSDCFRLTPRLQGPTGLRHRATSPRGTLAPMRLEAHQTSRIPEGVVSCRHG